MIEPFVSIQELSPSLKGVGCFPQDFPLKTQSPVCLTYIRCLGVYAVKYVG